jgi:hypothetical protein
MLRAYCIRNVSAFCKGHIEFIEGIEVIEGLRPQL